MGGRPNTDRTPMGDQPNTNRTPIEEYRTPMGEYRRAMGGQSKKNQRKCQEKRKIQRGFALEKYGGGEIKVISVLRKVQQDLNANI